MSVEPIYLLIALLPLITYLLVLGIVRWTGRVLITTGARDIAALGFAVGGLVAVGPGELFFPKAAAGVFGAWVWLALATFYALVVTLIGLTARPRLVVYGRSPEQMLDPLCRAAVQVDSEATADPETLQVHLPKLRVRLRVAGHNGVDSATVESFEPITAPAFWDQLLGHLRDQVATRQRPVPRRGAMMVLVAALLGVFVLWRALNEPLQVVEGFRGWLWR